MRKSLIIKILLISFGLSTSVFAGDAGKNKGPEISAEQKSEQGLEQGEAYAGTKEKKEDKDKGDKEKKEKSDKDKDGKEKKEKNDKDKDDKKEKKGKKGKKQK